MKFNHRQCSEGDLTQHRFWKNLSKGVGGLERHERPERGDPRDNDDWFTEGRHSLQGGGEWTTCLT